ncbi:pilus assembly protein [Mesorhizobium sp. M2D.F.Ca.ET.185.01.1.1]|uniref:TadE/TadG family type IV pilus assembly protein n=2 Tax=unclassified Mesorhizobium TaxID=325217 RepID=UPI000FCA2129|nr:pilus assembly protein [Mesorhizobium sp.]RVD57296.1 pilus assembly protein [Mesorhizobium sp. M2D.F.Ca.ET.140.01.1.1]TGP15871.1 pilus assembly protein [Mesorhizobium sp. M2D.F.Ca.ET.233.01.1.1]TGP37102.1 pilus assembly protein [Mesorhizobium sp. M2D.F.Ca.ET.232.01.1.1]TGP56937.1 pilus assembly protein [bacterium M00.F.Ca.ET.230.01.1.1]TGP65613.1 pilus assembly protein [Mesorhizobium sp. M2D.F.Ca.ET.226.01.1.1]TGP72090.1 pilus assembly protein [Mesorhizobium sp. M2D.F.Ca.ET.225.01.1.1]TGP
MLKNRKLPVFWSRFRADAAGTSAIEFAMLAPIFILLLLGMVAYGIYFGASHSVQQIAADAARTAIAGLNQTERQALVTDFIAHDVSGYPFVDANKLTVNAQDSAADGSQFVVSVSYDARNLPIWNLFKTLPLPGTTIQRQSTIRVGGI